MKIIALSDTHGAHEKWKLPEADLLIFAGDFSPGRGTQRDLLDFISWLMKQEQIKYKIIIAGNHDFCLLEQSNKQLIPKEITYLEDSSVNINGIKIYGSPWQPEFGNWAFNIERRSQRMIDIWNQIPEDTNILITHGPPLGILDKVMFDHHTGCEVLKERIKELKELKYHIFGHIHEGHGEIKEENTQYKNVSIMNDRYLPLNKPLVFDY